MDIFLGVSCSETGQGRSQRGASARQTGEPGQATRGGLGLLPLHMPETAAATGGMQVRTDLGFIHGIVPALRRVSPGQGRGTTHRV